VISELDANEQSKYHQKSGKGKGSLPIHGKKATVPAPNVGVKKNIHSSMSGMNQMNVVFIDCQDIFDCICIICFCCFSTLAFNFLSPVRVALSESALQAAISWLQAFICSLFVRSLFVSEVISEMLVEINRMKSVE
jgi:hypothetical protein